MRVEKRKIKRTAPEYPIVMDLIQKSTEVYNIGLQIARTAYQNEKTTNKKGEEVPVILSHFTLINRFRDEGYREKYKGAIPAQSVCLSLKGVADNFKSYVAALAAIKKNPSGFRGKIRLPRSKEEGEFYPFKISSQQVREKGNELHFPAIMGGLIITRKFEGRAKEVQFHPSVNGIVVSISYEDGREIPELPEVPTKVAGIDVGINNLFAVAGNFEPFLIDGKKLKSKNHYYCREYFNLKAEQAAEFARIEEKTGQKISKKEKSKNTLAMNQILRRRNNVISDYFHKATRTLINELKKLEVDTIVLGWTKKEKTEGTGVKAIMPLPLFKITKMLEYKCAEAGIRLIIKEESFTSGTSFIDGENPIESNYDADRRVYRGLFVSNDGTEINADVNAAYQVLKKTKKEEIPDHLMNEILDIPKTNIEMILSPRKIRVGW